MHEQLMDEIRGYCQQARQLREETAELQRSGLTDFQVREEIQQLLNRAEHLDGVADQKDGLSRQQALELIDRLEQEASDCKQLIRYNGAVQARQEQELEKLATPYGPAIPIRDMDVPRTEPQFTQPKPDSGSSGGRMDPVQGTGYTGGRTQKELEDLAGDPSHGGRIEDQGIKEREIVLDLKSQGKLGRIIRDPQVDKGSEFIDEITGQKWDIKSFESYPNGHTSPKKGAFTVDNAIKKIYKEFERGHNVIIDKRNLTPEHVEQLKDAIQKEGISDRIIWYP